MVILQEVKKNGKLESDVKRITLDHLFVNNLIWYKKTRIERIEK